MLVVAIWLLRASFENGGEAMFAGWSCGGKEVKVVVFELLGDGWSKIMIEKRKTAISKRRSPVNTRIPSKQRWGNLTAHKLTGITDLRTFMVYCEFPQL